MEYLETYVRMAYCLLVYLPLIFFFTLKEFQFVAFYQVLIIIKVMCTFGRDLHNNKLTGPIPPQIGRLKRLKILYEFSNPS
jgi:hypothetical protein